jgi:hypothetical protein
MVLKGILWLIAAAGLSLSALGQGALKPVPLPDDPLEMVKGPGLAVKAPANRAAVLKLLERARESYALRSSGLAYDLKVTFTVTSGGQTEFDGAWKMEDLFDPQQGLRWTANAPGPYAITRIYSNQQLFGEETASHIPLRLQEARAALFDPIPSAKNIARASIRISTTAVKGAKLTCVLLSGIDEKRAASATPWRRWDETEECIDPQSGLLRTHSQVPGRYYSYSYANGPQFGGHLMPRKVTVTEAGQTITKISVDSLTELPGADPSLFVPTDEMKARGRATAMTGAQKIFRVFDRGASATGGAAHVVCVFGVVTPSGQLVEAHSLQPADPNSQAALEAAKQMSFSQPAAPGDYPQQHFVFVIEQFTSSP